MSVILDRTAVLPGKLFFRSKDPFNNIYLNKGAYTDALHFLQADPDPDEKKKKNERRISILQRSWNILNKLIHRTYLLIWFSLYFCVSLLGKWMR
ncbi:MAG TPA: hypothetical protein PLU53_00500 [Bacteroidia bacterium]|nr:hypothetical protein [Bacteroidia bacterium]